MEALLRQPEPFHRSESAVDASVNWVRDGGPGMVETRFVRRDAKYIVVYLSSQTGCVQACRMCHLTATGQNKLRNMAVSEVWEQADVVLQHYRSVEPAESVHFNFMARGEPLVTPLMLDHSQELFGGLWDRAQAVDLRARFLVSTIMPSGLGDRALEDIFTRCKPEIYYSMYSVDPSFRRRWVPRAMSVDHALDRLAQWQRESYKIVKIHYAFIEGQNDAEADVHAVCDAIADRDLFVHINIVRYNPHSAKQGAEPAEAIIERNAEIFRQRLPKSRVKIIGRVGFDVQASCGMFV